MPRKLPHVAVSTSGDIVIIPANKKLAALILADDYDEWREDPSNFASHVIESKIQIDMLVTAITAEADFELEETDDGIVMIFRFQNGLALAVPIPHDGDIVQINPQHDFVALPSGVLHCEVSIEIEPKTPQIEFEHGDN
jgi:hypothetical protein